MKKPECGEMTKKCQKCDDSPIHYESVKSGEDPYHWYECPICHEQTNFFNSKELAKEAWQKLQSQS